MTAEHSRGMTDDQPWIPVRASQAHLPSSSSRDPVTDAYRCIRIYLAFIVKTINYSSDRRLAQLAVDHPGSSIGLRNVAAARGVVRVPRHYRETRMCIVRPHKCIGICVPFAATRRNSSHRERFVALARVSSAQ